MNTNIKLPIQEQIPMSSPIAFGCMGLGGGWNTDSISGKDIQHAHNVIDAAMEIGITFFDHADIYTFGKAEEVFGKVLAERPELRERMVIQTKCGIRFPDENAPKRYDFSAEWILHSVENSLRRLQTEQIDVFLLHRPDPLMETEEVAKVFSELKQSGKVKHFGVSNMHKHQIALLQSALDEPLLVNQIEMSLSHFSWLEEGVIMGTPGKAPVNFASGTIQFCQLNNIQLQSWGSLSKGLFSGRDVSSQPSPVQQVSRTVAKYAKEYGVSKEAIVLAWIMRHPARIQPIIGTTNTDRIRACAQATEIRLTREQWYNLYVYARGNELP